MKLRTQIELEKQKYNQIDHHSKLMLLGSCFVENIGEKLNYFKFQNTLNPFGILFQPLAIENLITNAINKKEFTEESTFFQNEQWHCFEAHSKLSAVSQEEVLGRLNDAVTETHKQLNQATHIIITLGTAWAYRHIEADVHVANCHKVPQKEFLKELLPVDTIAESLASTIAFIKSVNPKVSILFTVSPVRHLKDGFVENTQSKSHLIAAIHEVVEPREQIYYFPSYEIMMDELRDYRFYKEDMVHPNVTAINYIWEKFQEVWISEASNEIMTQVETIQKGLSHEPFNPNSEAHQQFVQQLESKKLELQSQFKNILF
jgi:lysophospholipase L1-like esterase